jgi:methyl-accepting chemotaxis protein
MKLKLPRRLGDIKIGPRLALSYTAILLLMIAALAFIGDSMRLAAEHSNNMFEDDIVKLEMVKQLSDSAQAVTRAMRTVMLLPRDSEVVKLEREKISAARKKYDDAMVTVLTLPSTEKGAELITKLEQDITILRSVDDKIIASYDQGKRDDAVDVLVKQGIPAYYEWQGVLEEYAALQKVKADESKQAIAQAFNKTVLVSITLSVLVLLVSAGAAFLITRSITSPLNELQKAINVVRQGGDMGSLAHIDSKDEFSDMGFAVNQVLQDQIAAREKEMAEREKADLDRQKAEAKNESLNNSVIALLQAVHQLSQRDLTARAPLSGDIIDTVADSINQLTDETSKVLRSVSQIANQVAQVSGKVRSQGELVSKTSEEERKNVGEMVLSLGEATETSNQIAELADKSNRSAERATQVTNTALETVNSTVKGMESIRETIAETEKRIKRLGERSQEISGIVNLINTISERTHVLALNASMQAAVAGEAGRGFAVVAEEVQRLAESSRNATQQIGTLVSNIQLETNETISTVNRTIGQVVQGSEQAQKAGEQMRLTQEITGELVEQVRLITGATVLQKEMSAMLLQSVQRLGQSNERTAQQIDTQSQETQTLLDSAQQLVESVNVFKLPQLA